MDYIYRVNSKTERKSEKRIVNEDGEHKTLGSLPKTFLLFNFCIWYSQLAKVTKALLFRYWFMNDDFLLSMQNLLGLLRSMYVMISLEEDAAFLRYGYLTTENAAEVRKEVKKLCSELRPHALALVSSFGIPDAFLSPIAFNWVDSNSWSSAQQH